MKVAVKIIFCLRDTYMDARRYGISPRVLNSVALKLAQRTSELLSSRREDKIFYLQATMYYFIDHINTIALF